MVKIRSLTTRSSRVLLLRSCGLLFIACWSLAVPAQTIDQSRAELHETYSLNPGGTVSVSNVSGTIRVTGWGESKVQVDALKRRHRGRDDLSQVEIQISAAADRLEIRTIYPRNRGRGFDISVDYTLKVPRTALLNSLTSVSGDVIVSDVSARAIARNVSGSITVRSVGETSATSISGNVTATEVRGALTARSTSGDLEIGEVMSTVNGTTTSGSIRAVGIGDAAALTTTSGKVWGERIGGRVTARSMSGSVFIRDASGDVEAGSVSDNVTLEKIKGRATVSSISGNIITRAVQEGVRARTVSGSIEITGARGSISAESTSGEIRLQNMESDDVRARSHSGTVRFQGGVTENGRYDFDSFSGEIVVILPASANFELTARTSSGEIETDFPVQVGPGTDLSSARRRIQATHGRGGAKLTLTGFSASIRLKKQ